MYHVAMQASREGYATAAFVAESASLNRCRAWKYEKYPSSPFCVSGISSRPLTKQSWRELDQPKRIFNVWKTISLRCVTQCHNRRWFHSHYMFTSRVHLRRRGRGNSSARLLLRRNHSSALATTNYSASTVNAKLGFVRVCVFSHKILSFVYQIQPNTVQSPKILSPLKNISNCISQIRFMLRARILNFGIPYWFFEECQKKGESQ